MTETSDTPTAESPPELPEPRSTREMRLERFETRVAEAADELVRRSSRVSVASIRRALGGGSPNEIAPALRLWRAKQQEKEFAALPSGFKALPKGLAEQLLEFWHGARAAIRAELAANPYALQGAGQDAELEALRAEVKELRARWHKEVEQGSAAHAELRRQQALASQALERAAETERQWRLTQIGQAADRQKLLELEVRVQELAEREAAASKEAARLQHKNEHLAAALTSAATQPAAIRRTKNTPRPAKAKKPKVIRAVRHPKARRPRKRPLQ